MFSFEKNADLPSKSKIQFFFVDDTIIGLEIGFCQRTSLRRIKALARKKREKRQNNLLGIFYPNDFLPYLIRTSGTLYQYTCVNCS